MVTLALDASTYTGSVAVWDGETLVAEGEAAMRGEAQERLMPEVAAVLARAGLAVADVGRVVCGGGPGSFTSLRIAGAVAKGIAMGNSVPLYAVSSLALIVAGQKTSLAAGKYFALLDALRGEFYGALCDVDPAGTVRTFSPSARIPASEIAMVCRDLGAVAIGPSQTIDALPHSRGALALLGGMEPVGLDTWEPEYGRLAEAQVQWELTHGRPLGTDRA